MSIYIDPPLWPAHGTLFSHMISDASVDELHAFAARAGLSARAFDRDHYDVPEHMYAWLVSLGAAEVSGRELVRILAACGLRVRNVERPEKVRTRLERAWDRLGGTLLGEPAGQWSLLGAELLDRWSEPHRHYHSMTHLASVLSAVGTLRRAGEPADPSVALAAWFHDAVYAGEAGADEEASAVLAEERLNSLLPGAVVDETARLVRLTATHSPAHDDHAGAVLVDADLEVLARSPQGYRRYAEQVRADYAHVPDEQFAAGRAAVLQRLLEHSRLYRTTTGHHRWEAAARQNLTAEVQSLRSGRPGFDLRGLDTRGIDLRGVDAR